VAGQTSTVAPRGEPAACQVASGSPSSRERTLSDVIEIVAVLGEPACAETILDFHCSDTLTRRWVALPAVTVLRHRALLSAMRGDPQTALDLLKTLPARTDRDPTETARALLMRGALRGLLGRSGQGREDLERASRLFLAAGLIDWCDACLRSLAATSGGSGTPRDADVATVLTGGYWGHHQITAVLRRSLAEVEAQLRTLAQAPSSV